MNKEIQNYFKGSIIDDTIIGLPENEFAELGKCYLCGRKLHFRNSLLSDRCDGLSFVGKRCGCCGAVYLTNRSIRLILEECQPDNLTLNYKKTVRYEQFKPTKRLSDFIRREDIVFVLGSHNYNIIKKMDLPKTILIIEMQKRFPKQLIYLIRMKIQTF